MFVKRGKFGARRIKQGQANGIEIGEEVHKDL